MLTYTVKLLCFAAFKLCDFGGKFISMHAILWFQTSKTVLQSQFIKDLN